MIRLAVTDVALAARCARQFVLRGEGFHVAEGPGGIGTAAHALLRALVERGAAHPAVARELGRRPLDEAGLQAAVAQAAYAEFFAQAPGVAGKLLAEDIERLARVAHEVGIFAAALLVRARRKGLGGAEAFARTFEASERKVEFSSKDGTVEVGGQIDLLCRDLASDRVYVCDLKTAATDVVADEQVRLYALALRRKGETAAPALVHATGDRLDVRRVALTEEDERRIEARLAALRDYVEGTAVPPAAPDPNTCRTCPVQAPCWNRWGRTLPGDRAEPAEDAAGAAGAAALRLEKVLRHHKIRVESVDPADVQIGPTVQRYRVRLKPGEHLDKVERRAADIQREMDWPRVPLIQNAPGNFIAIDAPRAPRAELDWSADCAAQLTGFEVPIGIGLDGALVKLDLVAAPHLLVAGTVGSGKTVFLQTLALALLQRLPREACEIIIVDPKAVDFTRFDRSALAEPVITDAAQAVALLKRLVDVDLPARKEVLQKHRVENRLKLPPGVLPALVVVVDEFADLLAVLADDKALQKDFLKSVQRLLQTSRAAGIHLVIATQRPSVDTVPGTLKAILPARVALQLPAAVDSQTVLDQAGAERLLGKGDLLFRNEGTTTRAQGFFVSGDKIEAIARPTGSAGPGAARGG